MNYHHRTGLPMDGCRASNAIKGKHERDAYGLCQLCGTGPEVPLTRATPPSPSTASEVGELHEAVPRSDIKDEVADIFRGCGFEVREPSDLDPKGQFAVCGSLDSAAILLETVLAPPTGAKCVLDLYDEIECDLEYLFGRASSEGHEVGQQLAKQVRAKMRSARVALAAKPAAREVEIGEFPQWVVMVRPGMVPVRKGPLANKKHTEDMLRELYELHADCQCMVISMPDECYPQSGIEWIDMYGDKRRKPIREVTASNPAPAGAAKGGNTQSSGTEVSVTNYGDAVDNVDVEAERKRFEAYMCAEKPLFPLAFNDAIDEYKSPGTQHRWEGWLAARTQVPAQTGSGEEITDAMADAGAEVLYGATRAQAVEYVKEDKFDSCAEQARAVFDAMRDAAKQKGE